MKKQMKKALLSSGIVWECEKHYSLSPVAGENTLLNTIEIVELSQQKIKQATSPPPRLPQFISTPPLSNLYQIVNCSTPPNYYDPPPNLPISTQISI